MLQEPSRPSREVTALQLLGTRVWLSPRQSTLTRVLTELCRNCNMRKSKFFNPIWAMDILFLSYFPYLFFLISLIHYRQHSDGMKKLDQAVKDVDYYRQVCVCMWSVLFHNMEYGSMFSQEAENLRTRYNDVVMEKQRLDQEVVSLRR